MDGVRLGKSQDIFFSEVGESDIKLEEVLQKDKGGTLYAKIKAAPKEEKKKEEVKADKPVFIDSSKEELKHEEFKKKDITISIP